MRGHSSSDAIVSSMDRPRSKNGFRPVQTEPLPARDAASSAAAGLPPLPEPIEVRAGQPGVRVPGIGVFSMEGNLARRDCIRVNRKPFTYWNMKFPLFDHMLMCVIESVGNKASHVKITFVRIEGTRDEAEKKWRSQTPPDAPAA